VQHELAVAADDGVRHLLEQSEGEVSPADKSTAMKAAVEKKALALRMKMAKLVAVANPELTDGWLCEVLINRSSLSLRTKLSYSQPLNSPQTHSHSHSHSQTLTNVSQIARHYTLNSIAPELNLEKLQLIATAKSSPASKIKWLEYFNSSASTREARKLPTKPTNADKLQAFLAKACFWEGVSI
jgi:hypothetical protein